ncbi:MAG: hypothetical protein KIS80_07490 [Anaerolineales bacterium]|nr:hypothetical protein [Anaerolineales bacterium]
MNKILVRTLSTGRTGTKFLSAVFNNQGYISFHEELYAGEPRMALMLYLHMLGDMWKEDPDHYFRFESRFAAPYVRTIAGLLEREENRPAWRRMLSSLLGKEQKKPGYVVHTAHLLTAATPVIEQELEKQGIESRNLILIRNPLKTIHAIYQVEGGNRNENRPYPLRAPSFSRDRTYIGAADVWANIYGMAMDQYRYYGAEKFKILELERFSNDSEYAADIFQFANLEFDQKRFKVFCQAELEKPFRASKVEDARNSDLFRNPNFVFSEEEIEAIYLAIKDVLVEYELDWRDCIEEYLRFHKDEKTKRGLA